MNKKLGFLVGFVLILFSALFLACNKSSDVGINLVPQQYILDPNAQDTFTVVAYTYKIDSLATNGITKALLGSYIDPIFGETRASFITEMRPMGVFTKGESPEFDSVVLYLKFDTLTAAYGNRNLEHEFKVYEIKKRLSLDSLYYSNLDPVSLDPQLITVSSFNPDKLLSNELIIKEDTIKNIFPLKLDFNFGKKLFDEDGIWTDTTFSAYFNGLLIQSNTLGFNGAISRFNLASTDSKLTLYYHNSKDTTSFSFGFSTYCTQFNLFEHQFNAPGFLPDLNNPENKEDSVVYVQGAGGLRTKIKFPYLDKIAENGTWIVNRAELVVSTEKGIISYEPDFAAPEELMLIRINDDGTYEYLSEFYTSTDYLGSGYENGQYIFDITYLVQKILKGEKSNNGLILMSKDGFENPSRAVITSGSNSNRMKLKLSLTKI